MKLELNPQMQKFIDDEVRSGRYDSPEGVVRQALALLKAQVDLTPDDVEELRRMLAPAIAQADRGELTPLDMDDVKRKAEAIRAGRRAG
jgi:putative addiction module CopG family antidote